MIPISLPPNSTPNDTPTPSDPKPQSAASAASRDSQTASPAARESRPAPVAASREGNSSVVEVQRPTSPRPAPQGSGAPYPPRPQAGPPGSQVPFTPRMGGGVSAPYNPRPAGVSAPYNPRPVGASAPYNPRPAGVSAPYNPRPAGAAAPYNPRPAAPQAPATADNAPREYDRSAYDRNADRNDRHGGGDKGPQVLNAKIRATEFRLIEDGGINRIVTRAEAEALSAETGMDLLIVSLESSPPVIRLVDFGKFKYESEKKAREARKKQHTTTVKEIKMGVRIDDNDYMVKVRRAQHFLEEGDKVKMTLRLKGREVQHSNLALELANQFVLDLEEYGILDGRVRQEGRTFMALFSPKPQVAKKVEKPVKAASAKPVADKLPSDTSASDPSAPVTDESLDPVALAQAPLLSESAEKDIDSHAQDEDA